MKTTRHAPLAFSSHKCSTFAVRLSQAHCRRVERASIDEAYLDLTEEAAKLCQEVEAGNARDVADSPETDLQVMLRSPHLGPWLNHFACEHDALIQRWSIVSRAHLRIPTFKRLVNRLLRLLWSLCMFCWSISPALGYGRPPCRPDERL